MVSRSFSVGVGLLACLVGVVPALGTHASAATLGGLSSASLTSDDVTASAPAPTVLSCDDFAFVAGTGSALAGRPVQKPGACGTGTWSTHLGTWTITSGRLSATTTNATASVPTLAVDGTVGTVEMSAEAVLENLNGSSREAGVAIDHSGSTRVYLSATVSNGSTVILRLVNGTSLTTLASVSGVAPGASTTIRLSRVGSVVSVAVNGAPIISHTLTSSRVKALRNGTRAGLVWRSGSTVRFVRLLVMGS